MRAKPDLKATAFGIAIGKRLFHVVALSAAEAVIQRVNFSGDTSLAFFRGPTEDADRHGNLPGLAMLGAAAGCDRT